MSELWNRRYRGGVILGEEKNFENKIKTFLKNEGCWYVKFFANAYTLRGVPDLLCCINGNFVAIEVKAKNGKLSDLQKLTIDRIRRSNGIAICLYPENFELFKKMVIQLKAEENTNKIFNSSVSDVRKLYNLAD